MCASLHKAQLLGGVKRQPPDRGYPGHSCSGSFRFPGSWQPESQLPVLGFQHGRHKRPQQVSPGMCTLLHLPQAARLCDRQVTDLCLSCFVGEMGEKETGDMVHRTESHLQDPHNKQQKQTNTVPQGWRGRDRWMAGAYWPGV